MRHDEKRRRSAVTEQILNSLAFESHSQRYDDVVDTHRKTFDWVFRSPEYGPHAAMGKQWSDFCSWLQHQDGVYWINGHEATGKSSLMKSIVTHPKADKLLKKWATSGGNDTTLFTAKFFFRANGTEKQRSQSGLYRSILHELLKRRPGSCPSSSRRNGKWHARARLWTTNKKQKFSWAAPSLQFAVKSLFSQNQVRLRACLFIDGLDQYEGDEFEIIDLFRSISSTSNIKCCVSSRRSPAFETAFSDRPSLQLEQLTYPEMQELVTDQLRSDERIAALTNANIDTFQVLVDEIVNSAKGVFLWMNLAVSSLLRGHGDQDGILEMHTRFQATPKRLEALYEYIVTRVDQTHLEECSRLLQLVVTASTSLKDDWRVVSPLSLLGLSFAVEDHPSMALTSQLHFLSQTEMQQRCEDMAARLGTVCAGLLQVQKRNLKDENVNTTSMVTFVHRTVKDYLMKWETQKLLRQQTRESQFNPNFAILKSTILLMKSGRHVSSSDRLSYHHIDDGILYARRAEAELGS
ncbi:uncharacterized protein BCR38DRAFT_362736, partial [Pseudomassariella vexata]